MHENRYISYRLIESEKIQANYADDSVHGCHQLSRTRQLQGKRSQQFRLAESYGKGDLYII